MASFGLPCMGNNRRCSWRVHRASILGFWLMTSRIFAVCLIVFSLNAITPGRVSAATVHHLVVLGDPHLPGQDITKKEQAIEKINSWKDVEMVVAVGDICAQYGTDTEYQTAKTFFGKLRAPFFPLAGNHDYFYANPTGSDGRLIEGSPTTKEKKLSKFRQIFGLSKYYYSRRLGDYLLVFLSADHPDFMAGMSERQLSWLRTELAENMEIPTIIFFHGPLQGTLRNYRHWVNTPNFIAQPEKILREILAANRQVFLWVSGHTHTSPLEESFASPINIYDGHITNIHNKDMNREIIWTNSLFLYPDKVIVKTFNHQENTWLPQLDRTIVLPRL
jgi:3',5'-cyclic-AMP phosphodiesterase